MGPVISVLIGVMSGIFILLAVLLGFVIRGSFIIGEIREGQRRINDELKGIKRKVRED